MYIFYIHINYKSLHLEEITRKVFFLTYINFLNLFYGNDSYSPRQQGAIGCC